MFWKSSMPGIIKDLPSFVHSFRQHVCCKIKIPKVANEIT